VCRCQTCSAPRPLKRGLWRPQVGPTSPCCSLWGRWGLFQAFTGGFWVRTRCLVQVTRSRPSPLAPLQPSPLSTPLTQPSALLHPAAGIVGATPSEAAGQRLCSSRTFVYSARFGPFSKQQCGAVTVSRGRSVARETRGAPWHMAAVL